MALASVAMDAVYMAVTDLQSEIPTIYDIELDEMRPVTQKDIERFEAMGRSYGALRYILRAFLTAKPAPGMSHDWELEAALLNELVRTLDKAKSRQSPAVEQGVKQ